MKPASAPTSKRALVAAKPVNGAQPAAFNSTDATSLQAVAAGTANDGQQKRALKWILEGACGLPVWAYCDSQRETDISLGRQFVGQQIMGLLKVNVSTLRKKEQNEEAVHG